MVSSVNFGTKPASGYILNKENTDGKAPLNNEKVVIMEREPDSFVKTSFHSVAYLKKAYNVVKETVGGTMRAVGAGLVTGATVMGLDWVIQRASGRGIKSQSGLLTPLKTVGNIIIGVAKKGLKVFSKDTSVTQILAYPFVGFPRDIYNYVKTAKGGSKAGKAIAVMVGLGAAAFSACRTLIKLNRLNADVDHGFKVGHNAD